MTEHDSPGERSRMSADAHLATWIATVEAYRGPVRRCLAHALARAADPTTLPDAS